MPWTPVSTEPRGPLLALERFGVGYAGPASFTTVASDIDLSVAPGECLAVVGESGAGKSQLFLAVVGLLGAGGQVWGSARLAGRELVGLPEAQLAQLRGRDVGLVFQDPSSALTPHLTIGTQLAEVRRRHLNESARAARSGALELLEQVHLADAARRLGQFPHELSGGMRQRVMIALALAAAPRLLIADEPTTALDATLQAQILALLAELKRARGLAVVLITHDLASVTGLADELAVLRAGRILEQGRAAAILARPREPYTARLIASARAALEARPPAPAGAGAAAALELEAVSVDLPVNRGLLRRPAQLRALDAVSLRLAEGASLGLVGESGSGKSTLARAALALLKIAHGRIVWLGSDPGVLPAAQLRRRRRDLQLIFQDPIASLDPRRRCLELVTEGLEVHEPHLSGAERHAAARRMLARVGLAEELERRYPHQLSGGQCQRVALARALVLSPRVLVCDEPLSALDAATREEIIELIATLRARERVSLLFISHDLAAVRTLCQEVLVLYLGRGIEQAPTAALFAQPRHPYTRELLAAIPALDPKLEAARLAAVRTGEPPSPLAPPSGCHYRSRCSYAEARCATERPPWEEVAPQRQVACLRWRELAGQL